MKPKIIALVYFIIGVTYTLIETRLSFGLGVALKGMIIPALILFYVISVRKNINIPVLTALLFSWAGDLFINFSFIPGLVFFLLGHIMYIIAFSMVPGKSILFIISDSLISVSKFYSPFRYSGITIMTTYIAAQYLIIYGIVKQGNFRSHDYKLDPFNPKLTLIKLML